MSISLEEELNSAFISPEKEFMGEKLAPYTEGSRLLLLQVRDDEDSSIYFIWSFIYIHILLAKNKKDAIKLAWNKNLFREKIMEYIEGKTEADREVATTIVSNILDEAQKGKVDVEHRLYLMGHSFSPNHASNPYLPMAKWGEV
jgi:hypothetical protein